MKDDYEAKKAKFLEEHPALDCDALKDIIDDLMKIEEDAEEPVSPDIGNLLEDQIVDLFELFGEEAEEKPKGKWMGICYESELDQEIGKNYA